MRPREALGGQTGKGLNRGQVRDRQGTGKGLNRTGQELDNNKLENFNLQSILRQNIKYPLDAENELQNILSCQ